MVSQVAKMEAPSLVKGNCDDLKWSIKLFAFNNEKHAHCTKTNKKTDDESVALVVTTNHENAHEAINQRINPAIKQAIK